MPGLCYVYWANHGSQAIPITVSGLAPGQTISLSLEVQGRALSGIPLSTADATGSVSTSLSSWTSGLPDGPTRSTPARLVATDANTGVVLDATSFKVGNVGISVDGADKGRLVKRLWEVSGLSVLGTQNIYWAHYFKGDQEIGKQRLGQATDAAATSA